ncbi:thioredoxin family protein [Peribacillus sp. SCS-155]|uniref:thioredoxin family protein n=1 Tax=Peribacillus sedimenti TaxID=3115297 RepID=UPI0039058284
MQEWQEHELNAAIQSKGNFCVFLYTPMCGTCQLASRILSISLELYPVVTCGKMNLNFLRHFPRQYEIESVPCLLVFKNGNLQNKIYAFHSVPYICDILKHVSR